jgi:hypothetical protein
VAAAVLLVAGCSSAPDAPAPPPTIPSDFLAYAEQTLPGTTPVAGELHGPHFGYALTGAGTTRSAPAGLDIAAGAVPAAGSDLFLATFGPTTAPPYENRPPTVELVVGSEVRPLDLTIPTGTLAVVVPAGAFPLLQVTDNGRRQTLDLRTGERGGDVPELYYPPVAAAWKATSPAVTTLRLGGPATAALSIPDRSVQIGLPTVTADLEPWIPEHGWAAEGRAWLVLAPRVTYRRTGAVPGRDDRVEVSPLALQATGPQGRYLLSSGSIRLETTGSTDTYAAEGTGRFYEDVPASLRGRIAVRFAFAGLVALPSGPTTLTQLADPTLTGTLTLA